ncbi:MAG: hypothetical protein LW884_09305 [Bacteroidetes bacterium]|jgi:hypothetical protein|nr:hypothetical protein [Bacteroidota bacterium]
MAILFEKRVTKDELTHKCVLLIDDAGKDYTADITGGAQTLEFYSEGKHYQAEVHEFFVGGAFKKGLITPVAADGSNNFFFEKSLTQGKRLRVSFEKGKLELEIFLVTR